MAASRASQGGAIAICRGHVRAGLCTASAGAHYDNPRGCCSHDSGASALYYAPRAITSRSVSLGTLREATESYPCRVSPRPVEVYLCLVSFEFYLFLASPRSALAV